MREQLVLSSVLIYVSRLVAIDRGFYVHQKTIRRLFAIDFRVLDQSNGAITPLRAQFLLTPGIQAKRLVELYRHAHVDPDLSHRVAQVFESKVDVATGVAGYYEMTTAKDHLLQAVVVEGPAVRQIHIRIRVRSQTECFLDSRSCGPTRELTPIGFVPGFSRVAKPCAEPHVEQSENE